MPTSYRAIQPPEQIGFTIQVNMTQLVIVIEKEFDYANKSNNWASFITEHYYGPFDDVVIDLGQCKTITSMVIAGLVHFADFYRQHCPDLLILGNVSQQIIRVLDMMKLKTLFRIEQSWKPRDTSLSGNIELKRSTLQRRENEKLGINDPDWME